MTNAINELTRFTYQDSGFLESITRNDAVTLASFAPDDLLRVGSATDQDGFGVSYAYDALNRLTLTTYPDGTSEETIYDRLLPGWVIDRLGRQTIYSYKQPPPARVHRGPGARAEQSHGP